ncbi:MAG: phosphohistidine phosphatase SixA [Bacteroidota bacterium]|nr:phosphohistidine phosphatase SixA [Bacteroidota bacterium]
MKTLYLLRHAEAESKIVHPDEIRDLTKRGVEEARITGKWLKEKHCQPDCIYTSHAHRAAQTAEEVARKIDFPREGIHVHELIYTGDRESLLDVIRETDDSINCLVVSGHNPSISDLAAQFARDSHLNMPTGAVAAFHINADSWEEAGDGNAHMVEFFSPARDF